MPILTRTVDMDSHKGAFEPEDPKEKGNTSMAGQTRRVSLIASVIWTLVVGFVIGMLGRLVVPGRQPIGCWVTTAVGVIGAFVGLLIGRNVDAGDGVTFLLEVAVAAVLVWIMAGRRRAL